MSEKDKIPDSPAIPRPGNKPYYIAPTCETCKTPLVLDDLLENPDTPEEEIWYDEFICPKCLDGIYMDWPESEWKNYELSQKDLEDCITLEQFLEEDRLK
ncbi:MAG: hypothetical protein ABRQ37_28805 [Candidatus Eremiobacterota bacterium]